MASVDTLRSLLSSLNLETRGNKTALKKRFRQSQLQSPSPSPPLPPGTRPPGEVYDYFLVVDVEATCEKIEGPCARRAFSFPNEIIEFPVVLLRWEMGHEGEWGLIEVDEFQTFVKPTWRPILSTFCTELTGITQRDVDTAPTYPEMLVQLREFINRHGLCAADTPTAWCSDGPWDLRDFIAKASYISQTKRPRWLAGKMIDLRLLASVYFSLNDKAIRLARRSPSPPLPSPLLASPSPSSSLPHSPVFSLAPSSPPSTRAATAISVATSIITKPPPTLSIPSVLLSLSLPPFIGRLHSGLADARNAARILVELARRGHPLLPNRTVPEGGIGGQERKWGWMQGKGKIDWEGWLEKEFGKGVLSGDIR